MSSELSSTTTPNAQTEQHILTLFLNILLFRSKNLYTLNGRWESPPAKCKQSRALQAYYVIVIIIFAGCVIMISAKVFLSLAFVHEVERRIHIWRCLRADSIPRTNSPTHYMVCHPVWWNCMLCSEKTVIFIVCLCVSCPQPQWTWSAISNAVGILFSYFPDDAYIA